MPKRTTAGSYASFLGAGAYRHYIPPVVGAIAMRGEFLTSYTPYQAEVSQGYLQAIYEWQTYIALLTGLDVANASVYDGATALGEGVIMAVNATGRKAVLVARAVHPNYRAVLRTYAEGLELTIDELPYAADGRTDLSSLDAVLAEQRYAAVVVQSPNFFGAIDALPPGAAERIRATKTVVIGVVAEAMSLARWRRRRRGARKSASAKRSRSGTRSRTADRTSASSRRATHTCGASRPAGGQVGRQRRQDGLRAHVAGARTAHQARKGDLEHLHQPGPLRAVRDDLPGRDGQDRAAQLRRAQRRRHERARVQSQRAGRLRAAL